MKHAHWIILVTLFIGGCLPACLAKDDPLAAVTAHQGVLDLRAVDLQHQSASLDGEWQFYWRRLLQPGDTISTPADFVTYPSLWNKIRLHGQTLPVEGYATYSLTILLPQKRPHLALLMTDVYCSYRLFINDSLLLANGRPDTSKQTAVPFWCTQMVNLPNTDTVHLLLQVANFWHTKGGTYKHLYIGQSNKITLNLRRDRAYDVLLAGCLFMGGLFFFGFYAFGSRDKAILYFSLFCIVYSYRTVGTSLYILHAVFPNLSWFVTIRLEYLSLTLGVALFSRYFQSVYPKDANRYIVNAVVWICLLYTGLIVTTPPHIFTKGIMPFLGVMFFYIAFALFICIRAVKFKRIGAVFALMSCGVMLLVFLIINLNYFQVVGTEKWIVFIGYVLFFFLQSLVLSHRFAYTLRKAADEAQQGLKTKTEFLSTMSHEIRTPLNVVIGMAHLMLRNTPRRDQEKNLNVLLFSANNLLSIVNDILDYNKIEAGKINFEMIPMDIGSIAQYITGGLSSKAVEKEITLNTTVDTRLTRKIIGDPTRTSQVIFNLVQNAIKFTEKGSVELAIQVEKLAEDKVTLAIKVTDTGIGIEPEKQQLIFDRFTQADSSTSRSYGGTGLGLAITKRILDLQGVVLNLKSEPGKGSVFFFAQNFALSNEQVATEDQSNAPIVSDKLLQDVHILVVEDNPFNIMVAQSLLERSGAIVEVATNGEEALEKIGPGKYHLILMDLNMPVMDGFEATRRLRARGITLPVIALTASLPAEVEKDVQSAGLTDIVVKPFNPDELFRVLLKHLK
ncbi:MULTISPECIES: response regulator [Niastella]|uniref:histidine kinase n=1 Tax=Niastella soli TaxID=2821487 RepID=A0ABS3YP64_9BACT|nr:response regulator [Niastella soli]MBO9199679.1 response regulator [Niastella soli]